MSASPKFPLLTTAQLIEEQERGSVVLDTRPAEQFAALHIRGSIQISLMGNFAGWAAILIDPAQRLVLIAEDLKHALEARERLTRVGFEDVAGYALGNEEQWREAGIELATISTQRCANVGSIAQHHSAVQFVDVRSRAEWLRGHLPGAISVPLLDLDARARSATNVKLLDQSKPSLVYCHEGYRATTAASILLRESAGKVGILIDGVEGWSACGLPLEMPSTEPG